MLNNYIKIALKVLLRRKFFTAISLFGISFTLIVLNIGASLVDEVITNSEIEKNLDRILISGEYRLTTGKGGSRNGSASISVLNRYFKDFSNVENQTFYSGRISQVNFTKNKKVSLKRRFTDAEYWNIYNFKFIEGKAFTKKQYDNGERVVIISKYVANVFFNGDALGKNFSVENKLFKVIGVVENIGFMNQETYADLWIPITSLSETLTGDNNPGSYRVAFLAKSSDDFSKIKAEFEQRRKQIDLPKSDRIKWVDVLFVLDSKLEKLSRDFSGDIYSTNSTGSILILCAVVILFMILPALNLININISRIMERSSEIGVRKSFGASSWDLVRQFLVENIILSLVGGIIALIVSIIIVPKLSSLNLFIYTDFTLNIRVFLIGICFAIFLGILSGVLPAYKMAKMNPVNALKGA